MQNWAFCYLSFIWRLSESVGFGGREGGNRASRTMQGQARGCKWTIIYKGQTVRVLKFLRRTLEARECGMVDCKFWKIVTANTDSYCYNWRRKNLFKSKSNWRNFWALNQPYRRHSDWIKKKTHLWGYRKEHARRLVEEEGEPNTIKSTKW